MTILLVYLAIGIVVFSWLAWFTPGEPLPAGWWTCFSEALATAGVIVFVMAAWPFIMLIHLLHRKGDR